jgi:hypothetical protein
MNNPAASGGESGPEEIEALEPPCARQGQTSEGFKGTVRAGTSPRGWGAGGVAGGACFSRRRCRRREAASTALGGIAADAVSSGSRLDDLHSAAVAGVGAVLHGGSRCGE